MGGSQPDTWSANGIVYEHARIEIQHINVTYKPQMGVCKISTTAKAENSLALILQTQKTINDQNTHNTTLHGT